MANYFNPYYQPVQMPVQQQMLPTQMSGTSSFVSVRNEMEARNYPIAPGNSITFKDEMAPYVYTKTMGFSQLDRPVFEKYKLIKETVAEPSDLPIEGGSDVQAINPALDELKAEIGRIWGEIDMLKKDSPKSRKKVSDDDAKSE